jgi:hypothetical protein
VVQCPPGRELKQYGGWQDPNVSAAAAEAAALPPPCTLALLPGQNLSLGRHRGCVQQLLLLQMQAPAVAPTAPAHLPLQGDGAKIMCGVSSLQPGCLIYSLGSNGDVSFEQDILKNTPCEVGRRAGGH